MTGSDRPEDPPVRVTWVIKGLGPGGAERLLVEAARAMTNVEAAAVYGLSGKSHLAGALRTAGVDVRGLGVRSFRDPRWIWRLVGAVRATAPDVIHVHSPALAPVVRLAAHTRVLGRHRAAVVTTEHNAWNTYRRLTRWANAVTGALDDLTIAVSEEVRASVPARLRGRVRVIRHGIDLDSVRQAVNERDAIRAEFGIGSAEIVVATVANYRAQKNYPNLLAAAVTVLQAVPQARFVAVGQGPLAPSVEGLHQRLGLGDRFVLAGYRADAVAVLAASDVFVLASDYEGLPVALMEALALGLPVVATAVGGVAETIGPEAGRLVPPGDSRSLADALVAVLRDTDGRRRLAAGAQDLGDTFGSAGTAAAVERSYREALVRVRRASSRTTATH